MPHVIVKLWPGKSEQQKTRLAEEIAKDVMGVLNYGEESVASSPSSIRRAGDHNFIFQCSSHTLYRWGVRGRVRSRDFAKEGQRNNENKVPVTIRSSTQISGNRNLSSRRPMLTVRSEIGPYRRPLQSCATCWDIA
jgi:hypothetical protein